MKDIEDIKTTTNIRFHVEGEMEKPHTGVWLRDHLSSPRLDTALDFIKKQREKYPNKNFRIVREEITETVFRVGDI